MRSAYEEYLDKRDFRLRILGHICTAIIAIMFTAIVLAACSKIKQQEEYKYRAEAVRCQENYISACKKMAETVGFRGVQNDF